LRICGWKLACMADVWVEVGVAVVWLEVGVVDV